VTLFGQVATRPQDSAEKAVEHIAGVAKVATNPGSPGDLVDNDIRRGLSRADVGLQPGTAIHIVVGHQTSRWSAASDSRDKNLAALGHEYRWSPA